VTLIEAVGAYIGVTQESPLEAMACRDFKENQQELLHITVCSQWHAGRPLQE